MQLQKIPVVSLFEMSMSSALQRSSNKRAPPAFALSCLFKLIHPSHALQSCIHRCLALFPKTISCTMRPSMPVLGLKVIRPPTTQASRAAKTRRILLTDFPFCHLVSLFHLASHPSALPFPSLASPLSLITRLSRSRFISFLVRLPH